MEVISKAIAQQIVDTVKDVCNQNINFIDEKGMIIASTDSTRINTFHQIGYEVVMKGETIEVADDDSFLGTRKGINIPITYNGNIIAVIGISGEVEAVRKYAYLAQKITDILLKERELESLGVQKKNRLNYVIRCLVNDEMMNPHYLTDTLKENGLSEDALCRVVLIQLNSRYNPNNLFMIQSAITQAFAQMNATFYRYNYPNEYILIIEDEKLVKNMPVLKRLADTYDKVLCIGIGSVVNIRNSAYSFQCAKLAVACRKKMASLISYDELDFELILGTVSEKLKKQYISKVTGKLSDEDKALLMTYFESEMSLQKTSETLFIHKNSLQYKLNRIYHISGYNPRKFQHAVVLYSAIKLENLTE